MAVVPPARLRANMWTGTESPEGDLTGRLWGLAGTGQSPAQMAAEVVDERDWRHPEIGWGLILADNEALSQAERATAADAPEPIRALAAARGGPVLRYRADLDDGYLRRYYPDRGFQDIAIEASPSGTAEGAIPRYLLIVGPPSEIPWSLQFQLNLSRCVGRLDLDDAGLENYVEALLSDWAGAAPDAGAPVLWNVDHGGDDITGLMAFAIGEKLRRRFETDPDAARRQSLTGDQATGAALAAALAEHKPAFIATTSHGMTGPLQNAPALVAKLGLPVDANFATVDPAALLGGWAPSGAIWYSHACCSAGSDAFSRYEDLFENGDPLRSLLTGVCSAAGARTAPLPRALLGASSPLRAFVGHVEPTFDWTLKDPDTGQMLSGAIVSALYNQLFRRDAPTPLSFALGAVFRESGSFYGSWGAAQRAAARGVPDGRARALYTKLAAMDRQGIVLLGDPTVTLAA